MSLLSFLGCLCLLPLLAALQLGDLYGNDSTGLGLSLEYWCVPEPDERSAVSKHHSTHRQVCRVEEGGSGGLLCSHCSVCGVGGL